MAEIRRSEEFKERTMLVAEGMELKQALHKSKERVEAEYALRLQIEATVEVLKRASHDSRQLSVDFSQREGQKEILHAQAEEEKKTLKNSIVALKAAYDEKEMQRLAELSSRKRAEGELAKMKSLMERATQDLAESTGRSKALRSEGKKARKQILDCVTLMRDVVDTVRRDAQAQGVELGGSTPSMRVDAVLAGATVKFNSMMPLGEDATGIVTEEQLLGLCEALGMPELTTAVSGMREVLLYLKEVNPKVKIEQENAMRRVEVEKNKLQREVAIMEEKGGDAGKGIQKQREEVRVLEGQLLDSRRKEVDSTLVLSRQISTLEDKLNREKDLKVAALSDLEKSRARGDLLSRDLEALRGVGGSQGTGLTLTAQQAESHRAEKIIAQREVERWKSEAYSSSSELKAVEHHRGILRDAVEQLERQLRLKTDALSDSRGGGGSQGGYGYREGAGSSAADEEEVLRRQIARYHARCSGMDELVAVYRSGLIALYADGSSYGAAQYAPFNDKNKGSFTGIYLLIHYD